MSRNRSFTPVAAFCLTLIVATTSFAQVPVLIAGFEDASLDGWGSVGGPGSPTYSQSNIGVTQGSFSLKSTNPQNGFWGPSSGNLIPVNRDNFINATSLSFDITMIGSEINGGSGSFDGFAQANEISISLFSAVAPGVNIFAQRGAFGALTDSSGLNGQWSGVDGTRTHTWNLLAVTAVDPTDGLTKPVGQIAANHPELELIRINLVEQFGNGTATVGPGSFFYDNVRLNVIPEPASLALVGLLLPALALRRRS